MLLPEMKNKSDNALYKIAGRFLDRCSLVYRMGTKESQRPPNEVSAEALDFIEYARAAVAGRDKRFVMNMDQTPVYFSMHSKRTLEKKGVRTVNVLTSTNDTRRVTVAATITASGDQLTPFVIFKGSPTGRIASEQVPTYDHTSIYDLQKNAWMDERVMLRWVDEVIEPYVATAPEDVVPVLLLDSYRCHIMASVVNKITKLGVEVIHIPGGCTGLVQPLDVGYNRPFKVRIRKKWQEWMMNSVKASGTITAPGREDVSAWIAESFWELDKKRRVIKNAWLKSGYEWFEKNN